MKILIADDSRAMRMVIRAMLREAGFRGLDIVEAVDGADALVKAGTEAPDLVISDWNMPNKTGIEFLQELRAAGNKVTFGFVTTEVSHEQRAKAGEFGAAFVIAKPFNAKDFELALGPHLN
jgi:two-component system chemotaxis response regulator CheY